MNPPHPTPPCAGSAKFRRAPLTGPLRSVTSGLHGFAAAHWWRRYAPHQIPFPPSRFQMSTRRAAAEDGAGFPSPSHVRPGRRRAGVKGELRCVVSNALRAGSPSGSSAQRCKRSIHLGELAFYYPKERSLYCQPKSAAKRHVGNSRRRYSTRRTTLRCRE